MHTPSSTIISTLVLLLPIQVHAGNCRQVSSTYLCGGMVNRTPHALKYTTNPNTGGSHMCKFWNWSGGDEGTGGPTLRCTQQTLAAGARVGGGGKTKTTDVDAFCFADRDYTVDLGGGYLRRVTRGVWMKISDDQIFTCSMSGGMPLCTGA